MSCSSAAAACTRVASCPASTPRAAPARSPGPSPGSASRALAQQLDGAAMLPGLVRLRLGGAGCSAGVGLRSAVRTCTLGRPASSGRVSDGAGTRGAAAAAGLGLRGLWGLPCRPAPAGSTAAASVSTSTSVGPAASAPLSAASCPAAPLASSPAPSSAPSLAAAAAAAARHRHLSTLARAASGPPSGSGADAGGKKQKAQAQAQGQVQVQTKAKPPPPPPPAAAPAPTAVRYSPLHHNIEEFAAKVVLTEGERRQRMEIIEGVRAGVRRVWPNARSVELQVFGSFANGLSTWNSDIDLVVTGVCAPDRMTGGYEPSDRARITSKLRKLSEALNRAKQIDIVRQQFIPRARIPILKLWTKSRVCVDVSMGDDSGPRAARYMTQQCRAYPPLKPLVLVLKAYLKACRLNEVNTGGLSSYSLTNMVIAHLQEELKAGEDISDLGETLYTFLLRYGREFDYGMQAVSVASGGIVPKASLGMAMESARMAAASMGSHDGAVSWMQRLCVDCPLTGRDVSNGSFRIDLVRGAFEAGAKNLEIMVKGRRISDTSINYLQALFDVSRVLRRSPEPYEDGLYRVVGGRSDDEEGEDLPLSEGASSPGEDEDDDDDDLAGDYLQR